LKYAKFFLCAATALAPLTARAQPAAPPPSDNSVTEVVVTAQKRTERLQDVPVAITALSSTDLANANVTDERSLVNVTPGLRMDQTGTFTQPTIRGVGSEITQIGASAATGTYVDGFYQPSEIGNDFDLGNVSQVEVLKGPQGTLFGRNSTGGAIVITTKDPSFTAGGSADASVRSYNDDRASIYLTGPITDNLAANLSIYGRDSEGWKTDVVTGRHDSPNHTFDVRAKLLYKPTTDLKFLVILQHSDIYDPAAAAYSTYDDNSVANAIPGAIFTNNRFNTAMPNPPKNLIEANAIYLKTQYDFDWATLTSYTGFRDERAEEQSQIDRTSLKLFTAAWSPYERTFTQEVNLTSTASGPFKWVVGTFYDHDVDGYKAFYFNGFDALGDANVTTHAYAGYADGTYEVLHNLYLTAGVRFSDETQRYFYNAQAAAPLPTVATYQHTWTSTNERAVLRYEFTKDTNVYASYSNGFKSGAYNNNNFASTPVNPETITAYEVGFKTAQQKWRFDSSAYYYNYNNLQFTAYEFNSATDTQVVELENAARATIYGADAQLTYQILSDFNIRLGGAWTHGRYDSFPQAIEYFPTTSTAACPSTAAEVVRVGGIPLVGNCQYLASASGKTMVRAPDFTLTAGADYSTQTPYGRLTLSENLYVSSRVFFDPTDSVSQPAYATLDLKATLNLPNSRWSVSVFGDNVTDTKYVTQVAEDVFGYGAVYGNPSSFGVGASMRF
jgi:iron complex outermembrane receptor protein